MQRRFSDAPPEGSVSRILVFPCWTQIPIMPFTWDWLHATPAPHLHTHIKATHTHHFSAKSQLSFLSVVTRVRFITFWSWTVIPFLIVLCLPRLWLFTGLWFYPPASIPRLTLDSVSIALFTGVYSACLTILNKSYKWIQLSLMLHNTLKGTVFRTMSMVFYFHLTG